MQKSRRSNARRPVDSAFRALLERMKRHEHPAARIRISLRDGGGRRIASVPLGAAVAEALVEPVTAIRDWLAAIANGCRLTVERAS